MNKVQPLGRQVSGRLAVQMAVQGPQHLGSKAQTVGMGLDVFGHGNPPYPLEHQPPPPLKLQQILHPRRGRSQQPNLLGKVGLQLGVGQGKLRPE